MVVVARRRLCLTIQKSFLLDSHRPLTRRCALSTLAVLEQRDGRLCDGSLSAISAARLLGGTIHAFVAGAKADVAAKEAARLDNLDKVICVKNEAYEKVKRALFFFLVGLESPLLTANCLSFFFFIKGPAGDIRSPPRREY